MTIKLTIGRGFENLLESFHKINFDLFYGNRIFLIIKVKLILIIVLNGTHFQFNLDNNIPENIHSTTKLQVCTESCNAFYNPLTIFQIRSKGHYLQAESLQTFR